MDNYTDVTSNARTIVRDANEAADDEGPPVGTGGPSSCGSSYFQRVVIAKPAINNTKPMARFQVPMPGTGYLEPDR